MRILELSPAAKRKAAKVVAHAKLRRHWYNPHSAGWLGRIPGNDKSHQCKLNTFRCVFSYTINTSFTEVMRHLSISVPSEKFPNPVAVKEIAKMFGFTGAGETTDADYPSDWVVHIQKDHQVDDDCIVVGQGTGIKP